MSSKTKPRLSKGILEMKFMKRTKDQTLKDDEEAEGRAMYSNEITKKMLNESSNFIIEQSFVHCENLIDGRLSFRGMNPEIEKIMELEQLKKDAKANGEMAKDVDDEQMMKVHSKNIANNRNQNNKKFQSKKRINGEKTKNNKKMKFLKPKDDSD